jgi:hypothetical protein
LIAAALNGNSSNDIYYAYSRLHRAGESLTPEEYLNFMDSCRTSKKSRVVEILYSMIDRDVQVDRRHFQRALMVRFARLYSSLALSVKVTDQSIRHAQTRAI